MIYPNGDPRCADPIAGQVIGIEKWLAHFSGRNVCIQAGGNIGLYPNELAKHFAQVITFEPESLNFECLKENCKASNITCINGALGDTRGGVGMVIDPLNIGAHYLAGDGTINIHVIDDSFDPSLSVDLIALDVEGYEWQALKGAEQTIERCKPAIVVELKGHGKRYGYEDSELIDWLKARGYSHREKVFRDHVFTCL